MFFSALKGLKIKRSLKSGQTILTNPAVSTAGLCCIDERCLLKDLQHLSHFLVWMLGPLLCIVVSFTPARSCSDIEDSGGNQSPAGKANSPTMVKCRRLSSKHIFNVAVGERYVLFVYFTVSSPPPLFFLSSENSDRVALTRLNC